MFWLKKNLAKLFGGRVSPAADIDIPVSVSATRGFDAYIELGYHPLAQRMVARHLDEHPQDLGAWCQAAEVSACLGHQRELVTALVRCLQLASTHSQWDSRVVRLLRDTDFALLRTLPEYEDFVGRVSPSPRALLAIKQSQAEGQLTDVIHQVERFLRSDLTDYDAVDFALNALVQCASREVVSTALDGLAASSAGDVRARQLILAKYYQRIQATGVALSLLQALADVPPVSREVYLALSNLLTDRHDFTAAAVLLEQAIECYAEDVTLHHCLVKALRQIGNTEKAIAVTETAIAAAACTELSHFLLGEIYFDDHKVTDAHSEFTFAININPLFAEALVRAGDVDLKQGNYAQAESEYQLALGIDDTLEPALIGYAAALQTQDKWEAAVKANRQLLRLQPNAVPVMNNLGLALRGQGDYEESRKLLQQVLAVDGGNIAVLHNYGMVLADLGLADEAVRILTQVLQKQGFNKVEVQISRAFARLRNLDFAAGWEDYEARWQQADNARPFTSPQWDGLDCHGKTLLIFGEQGLGDEIMFVSCLPDVLARCDSVIIECDSRLGALFSRSFPTARVQRRKDLHDQSWLRNAGHIDLQCASGSLPRFFRRSAAEFPVHSGYLRADVEKVERWKKQLSTLPGTIKVGLSWRGGTNKSLGNLRSLKLAQLAPLLTLKNVTFVNLQYGDVRGECEAVAAELGRPIVQFPEAIADYDETAALVTALDLVISVQTAVVHLAGALGREAWVMLPFSPEWRYARSGDRMVWYPSVRLFRQPQPKDWGSVMAELAAELALRVVSV